MLAATGLGCWYTARALVLEHGADYLFTVKGNQSTVHENIKRLVPEPPPAFFP